MNRRFQNNEQIGDYRVLGFIGKGGMGEVYHAVHEKLGRSVAVKVLGGNVSLDESYKTRFFNEARLQASLHHPNIATLYDFREYENALLIFMEFIDGEGLDDLAVRRHFSVEESLKVFESIVKAISYIHANGIIHRDIKAENVKLSQTGVPKLLDFGIAKDFNSRNLTQVGGVIGTPNYFAPEQLQGEIANEKTDIWSLGVLLYRMLTGKLPFESESFESLIYQVSQGNFEAPENLNPAIPKSVSNIVKKCLNKDLNQRYQTADEVSSDIGKVLNERYSNDNLFTPFAGNKSFSVAKISFFAVPVLLFFGLIGMGIWAISGSDDPVEVKPPVKVSETPNKNTSAEKKSESSIAQTEKKSEPILNSSGKSKRAIRLDAVGGSAEVWRNGQKIGTTPMDLEISENEIINLKLKRQGSLDTDVQVQPSTGKKVYTFSLASK